MLRRNIFATLIIILLVACSAKSQGTKPSWKYGVGTNIDLVCTTNVTFYKGGKRIFNYPGGGCNAGAPHEYIINKKYYWTGGGGLPVQGVPIPDSARLEFVSFYDSKRYRLTINLPENLEQRMQQGFRVGERIDQRNWLYFGLAPGGYYEVLLFGGINGVGPDLLLAKGIAQEVTDDWYDKKVSINEQYGIASYDKEYNVLFKKHPIPTGMEWAPIMDAYRAKQPKTDLHPVN